MQTTRQVTRQCLHSETIKLPGRALDMSWQAGNNNQVGRQMLRVGGISVGPTPMTTKAVADATDFIMADGKKVTINKSTTAKNNNQTATKGNSKSRTTTKTVSRTSACLDDCIRKSKLPSDGTFSLDNESKIEENEYIGQCGNHTCRSWRPRRPLVDKSAQQQRRRDATTRTVDCKFTQQQQQQQQQQEHDNKNSRQYKRDNQSLNHTCHNNKNKVGQFASRRRVPPSAATAGWHAQPDF